MHRSLILLSHSKELSCCIEWENYDDFFSQLSSQVVVSFLFSATKNNIHSFTFCPAFVDETVLYIGSLVVSFFFLFSKKGVHGCPGWPYLCSIERL